MAIQQHQKVYVAGGRQYCRVSGFTSSGTVVLPLVTDELRLCALNVRPLLSPDGKAVTLEMRFVVEDNPQDREEPAVAGTIPGTAGGKPQPFVNKVTLPEMGVSIVRGAPAAPLGRYILAGTFRRSSEAAKAAPNVLMLVKAEVCPPAGDRPAKPE